MRKEPVYPEQYYHIYNRGVAKGKIFYQPSHWSFFLRRLKKYFLPEFADILAYCLMPNHYHLLVHVKCEDFGREVMHPLSVSFTRAINQDMNRVGPLFQSHYQYKRISSTEHLIHLTKYIHRNPVDAGLVSQPEKWIYSSYQEYIGMRSGTLPKTDFELLGFRTSEEYQDYANLPMDENKIKDFLFNET